MATAFVFTACSEEEGDGGANKLAGTTWKILSSDEDEELEGRTIKFNKNGNFTFNPDYGWDYAKWKLNGDVLKLTVGEGGAADDSMVGKLTITGNKATYRYRWEDASGSNEDEEEPTYYNIVLLKQ